MKKIILSIALAIGLVSCQDSPRQTSYVQQQPAQEVVVTPANTQVGDNLDLQSLGELVKQSANAQDIENKLNSSGSINNLDLDGDGQVDYIKVNEVSANGTKGFEFLVDTNGTPQQVAVVNLQQNAGVVQVNIQGNQDIYGPQAYYTSSHALRDLMIMNYLYSYHRPYYSPYHYGYYPRTYRSYRAVPVNNYRSSRVTTRTTRTYSRPSATRTQRNSSFGNSTYKARPVTASTNRTRSMARPTGSQKSFSVTSTAKSRPSTSGFGSQKASRPSSYTSRPSSSYTSKPSRSYTSPSRSNSSRSSSFGSSSRSGSRRR